MDEKRRDTDYLFLTTRVRALECSLLDKGKMDQMLEAATPEDAARILTDCGYPELEVVNGKTVGDLLSQERARTLNDLAELVPDPTVLAVFQVQYDYHNGKVLLKSEAMGIQSDRLLMDTGRVAPETLAAALRGGVTTSDLPPLLAQGLQEARQVLSATRDPPLGDFTLDRYYFQELQEMAQRTGSTFLAGYVQRLIDTANLRTVVRVLRMGRGGEFLEGTLFEGGTMEAGRLLESVNASTMLEELYASTPLEQAAEAGAAAVRGEGLTLFEKLCDNAVIHYIQDARFVSFGEAPVIAYLAAKEAEIVAIRIIMTGRLAGLPTDVIRERLREAYV